MAKPPAPPSQVRIVSHEAVSETEVKITVEVIVDVHRLAEVGRDFLVAATQQAILSKPPKR